MLCSIELLNNLLILIMHGSMGCCAHRLSPIMHCSWSLSKALVRMYVPCLIVVLSALKLWTETYSPLHRCRNRLGTTRQVCYSRIGLCAHGPWVIDVRGHCRLWLLDLWALVSMDSVSSVCVNIVVWLGFELSLERHYWGVSSWGLMAMADGASFRWYACLGLLHDSNIEDNKALVLWDLGLWMRFGGPQKQKRGDHRSPLF